MRLASSPDRCCELRTPCCAKKPRRTLDASVEIPTPSGPSSTFLPRRRRPAPGRRCVAQLSVWRGFEAGVVRPRIERAWACATALFTASTSLRTFRHRPPSSIARPSNFRPARAPDRDCTFSAPPAALPSPSAPASSKALRMSAASSSKSRRIAAISARRCRSNSSSPGPANVRIASAISNCTCSARGTTLSMRQRRFHWPDLGGKSLSRRMRVGLAGALCAPVREQFWI